MKILNSIYSGSYTEEQTALVAEIEQTLDLIMRNPNPFNIKRDYSCNDVSKYKKELQKLNHKFTRVFTGSPGIYVYQSQYCSIQWFLEQHLKDNVRMWFSFKYSDELFRFAFIHEIAIFTHRMPDTVLYPIQIRCIVVWLLLCYFDCAHFKTKEYARVFALASDCLNTDQSDLQEIRNEIAGFKTLYQADIDDLNASKNLARQIKRKARRIVYNRRCAKDLEIMHFMVCNATSGDYFEMLKGAAKRYHLSYKTVRNRAKAIGLTEKVYDAKYQWLYSYMDDVHEEYEKAQEILIHGPFPKEGTWEHYKKRFKIGRTFFSGITRELEDDEMIESEQVQQPISYEPLLKEYLPNGKRNPDYVRHLFGLMDDSNLVPEPEPEIEQQTCTPTFNASELKSEQDWLTLTTLQTVDAVLTYEWLTPPPAFAIERIRQATGGHYVTNVPTYIKPETDWTNLTPEKMIDAILFSPAGTPIPATVFDAIIEAKERERNPTPVEPTPEKDPSEMTMEEIIATLF